MRALLRRRLMTTDPSSGLTFTWDGRNQLANGGGAAFGYDPFGRRTSAGTGTGGYSFIYDGLNIARQIHMGTNTDVLSGLGLDDILTVNDSGVKAELPDGLPGSTLGLVNSNHAISTSYSYQPFGQKTNSGSTSNNPATFQRGVQRGGGVYYFRNRYYNPALQRWMSRDPLGLGHGAPSPYAFFHPWVPSGRIGPSGVPIPRLFAPRMQIAPPGGGNLYAYANNDPINFNDPLGLLAGSLGASDGWAHVGGSRTGTGWGNGPGASGGEAGSGGGGVFGQDGNSVGSGPATQDLNPGETYAGFTQDGTWVSVTCEADGTLTVNGVNSGWPSMVIGGTQFNCGATLT